MRMRADQEMICFAAVGLIVALTAPAFADTVSNRLAANRLAANKLATNGIRLDGFGVAAPAGEGAVADIVGIELQDGTSFAR